MVIIEFVVVSQMVEEHRQPSEIPVQIVNKDDILRENGAETTTFRFENELLKSVLFKMQEIDVVVLGVLWKPTTPHCFHFNHEEITNH